VILAPHYLVDIISDQRPVSLAESIGLLLLQSLAVVFAMFEPIFMRSVSASKAGKDSQIP